ncbi:MAG TPA: hypothetical protein PKA06_05675, partial [Gemmatales bacterium]|nr:hypothetical protein [Gemmatales bacterium]
VSSTYLNPSPETCFATSYPTPALAPGSLRRSETLLRFDPVARRDVVARLQGRVEYYTRLPRLYPGRIIQAPGSSSNGRSYVKSQQGKIHPRALGVCITSLARRTPEETAFLLPHNKR